MADEHRAMNVSPNTFMVLLFMSICNNSRFTYSLNSTVKAMSYMYKQLKPSFAILLICCIYGMLPVAEQDVFL